MINIAICDDEVYMLNLLTEKVLGFFKQENMEITIFRFQNGEALLDYDKKLDIVFLDIQMGEPDGLETAKELRGRGYGGFLIFITVLQEYVFNAFEVQAFDYLVKLSLNDADRELINALFFDGASTRDYAARIGITQRAVIKRRDRILRDLKKYFENFSN